MSVETDLRLFREPERARRDLERLRELVAEPVYHALGPLLADSPDPDQALNLFERLTSEGNGELPALFGRNRALLYYAIAIFGHSYWLGETLLRNTDLLQTLGREKQLDRSLEHDDYRKRLADFRALTSTPEVSALLARFKKREYVRIALRDTLGIATLGETTAEISALADVIIQAALREIEMQADARRATGRSRFAVLGLGKLGGNELNYSSDVDLLYIYDAGEPSDPLHSRGQFIRQAQLLTELLSRATTEGAAFRIDLRLRPLGSEGETAIEVKQAIDYYLRAAHDWELQALIKARYVAGDAALARDFIHAVQKKVYTEHLNFAAIETALRSREKMEVRRRQGLARATAVPDVKLDRGGIRDIEFLVQCLQRVYGGREPWLQSGGTLFSLQKLHDKDHLEANDFHDLTLAYEFLRKLEHRLQLQRGQQLHRLPQSAAELEILRRALGDGLRQTGAGDLASSVQSCMQKVAEIYERIIHSERGGKRRRVSGLSAGVDRESSLEELVQKVSAESPALGAVIANPALGRQARRSLQRFLSSAMNSSAAHAALLENPGAFRQVLQLLEDSEYLTEILVRNPEALNQLRAGLSTRTEHSAEAFSSSPADLGETMALLRRGFREHIFLTGARDVIASRPAFESMRETTSLGIASIRCALRAAGGDEALAVFALGRMGTDEFDIASDADLLFVRGPGSDPEQARSMAEKLLHVLAAYTREGTVFAVDARLRPRGGEGELVVTAEQLEKYLANEAQPWEALTYTKLRFVAGREELAPPALTQVSQRIVAMARTVDFPREVLEMRSRLEKSNRYPHSFKLARGGFYDIDFIASFLMLANNSPHPGNTLERLKHLRGKHLLDETTFAILAQATLLYRTTDHVIRLVTGRARPELPEGEHAREATIKLVNQILQRDAGSRDLQAELEATQEQVRGRFLELIS